MRPAANSTASSVINAEPASYPQISQTRQLSTPSEPFGREILLLARRRFGDSAEFCQNFLLAEDQVLLIIDLDLTAGVFAEQDPVTHLHVERDTAFLFHLSGSDGHYFALLRFFFSRIGDDDPTLRGFLFFQPPHKHAVMQGSDIHSHFFNLRLIHSKDSNSKLVLTLDQHYGRKIFRFFCRAASRSSASFFWRSISFCGSSCPSSFTDLAIAASACASSPFENMTSAKEFRNLERTRFIE